MRRKFALFLFVPIFILIFTGCGFMAGDDRNEDAMATAISQTLAA
jgi:hypothetical protein